MKDYYFHFDIIHIPSVSYIDDDWFGVFPVSLTDEDFAEMVSKYKEWKTIEEGQNFIKSDNDDEFFLRNYCPSIHCKVKKALKEFALKNWSKEINNALDQADIIMPDELYFAVDPEFSMDAQSDYFWGKKGS